MQRVKREKMKDECMNKSKTKKCETNNESKMILIKNGRKKNQNQSGPVLGGPEGGGLHTRAHPAQTHPAPKINTKKSKGKWRKTNMKNWRIETKKERQKGITTKEKEHVTVKLKTRRKIKQKREIKKRKEHF